MDSLNGEEKKDASKEDLEQEEGRADNLFDFAELFENSKEKIGKRRPRIRNFYRMFNNDNDNWNYLSDLEDEGEGEEQEIGDGEIIIADEDPLQSNYPTDCCPENCYKKFPFLAGDDDAPFWQGWANLRYKTFKLIENKYFETAVITMILLSSLALVKLFPYLFEIYT